MPEIKIIREEAFFEFLIETELQLLEKGHIKTDFFLGAIITAFFIGRGFIVTQEILDADLIRITLLGKRNADA